MTTVPPPYAQEGPAPSETGAQVITVDGPVSVLIKYQILNKDGLKHLVFKEETTGQDAYRTKLSGGSTAGDKRTKMELVSLSTQETTAANVTLIPDEYEHIASVQTPTWKKYKAITVGDPTKYKPKVKGELRFPVVGLPQSLVWQPSKSYVYQGKGEGNGGDYELRDSEGNLYAIFLNHWKGSSFQVDCGRLCLLPIAAENNLSEVIVGSYLALWFYISWRITERNEKLAAGGAAAFICCTVS